MVTAVTPLEDTEDLVDPSTVKCVFDQEMKALYFSRFAIPFLQNREHRKALYRHLGIYGFQTNFLKIWKSLSPTPLETG